MCENVPIGVLIKVTDKEIERNFNNKTLQLGLTSAQMHILHFICRNSGRICQKDIEERFDLTHATVSGIITRLRNKGFITTGQGSDKRRKTVSATDKARKCDGEMHAFIESHNLQLMDGFSEEEEACLRGYLIKILSNLGFDFCADGQDGAAREGAIK